MTKTFPIDSESFCGSATPDSPNIVNECIMQMAVPTMAKAGSRAEKSKSFDMSFIEIMVDTCHANGLRREMECFFALRVYREKKTTLQQCDGVRFAVALRAVNDKLHD